MVFPRKLGVKSFFPRIFGSQIFILQNSFYHLLREYDVCVCACIQETVRNTVKGIVLHFLPSSCPVRMLFCLQHRASAHCHEEWSTLREKRDLPSMFFQKNPGICGSGLSNDFFERLQADRSPLRMTRHTKPLEFVIIICIPNDIHQRTFIH